MCNFNTTDYEAFLRDLREYRRRAEQRALEAAERCALDSNSNALEKLIRERAKVAAATFLDTPNWDFWGFGPTRDRALDEILRLAGDDAPKSPLLQVQDWAFVRELARFVHLLSAR